MWLLEIFILFGLAFCFVNSNEECNNEFDSDCFCYDEPGDNHKYSICVDDPCLSDHPGLNYRRVGQRCIYFDNSTSDYAVARTRCKSTFNGKGKMYEPINFEESLKIALEGKSKFGKQVWWIGVKDINKNKKEEKFVFDSDGSPIPFTPKWYVASYNPHTKDCALVFATGWQGWQRWPCSATDVGTLCEYGE